MLVKCPKCELNYMENTDKMCKVCFREIHGADRLEEQELCSLCNDAPVLFGKDVCSTCLKEMNEDREPSDDEDEESLDDSDDAVSTMDEIVPDLTDTDDIPEPEFQEIDRNLSLDELSEQEEADADEEEDDDR